MPDDLNTPPLPDYLRPLDEVEVEDGHDEWFRTKVQEALDDKANGTATYTPFREVIARLEAKYAP